MGYGCVMITQTDLDELVSINEARAIIGLRPLKVNKRKCMWCDEEFEVIGITAYCEKCKRNFKRREDYEKE